MSRWIDFNKDERLAMIQKVAEANNIDETAAEKDWWVTAVLYALFHTSVARYLLFKGGTSLSKGWNLINRFSEDVDLALNREYFLEIKKLNCANCNSNTQIHNFREKAQDFLLGEFKEELADVMREMGLEVNVIGENEFKDENGNLIKIDHDKDPSLIVVWYPSIFTRSDRYASPEVKIEISVLSMSEPFENRTISSLIAEEYMKDGIDQDYTQDIKTVRPERTFLEKSFLLCEEYQKPEPRTFRMSRHLYDLEKLMDTQFANNALTDTKLYKKIVEHRETFYHVGAVDYSKELPDSITLVPYDKLIKDFESDYTDMRSSFIYGDSLDFKALISRISELQGRFRNIKLH
jgi:predicted nucleotidyltransferase component of viral defense system